MTQIRSTANFSANLDSIEAFWDACEFPEGHGKLLAELASSTLAHLQNHPRMGRDFLRRQSESIDAQARLQKLRTQGATTLNAEIREYVMSDYLLLYALADDVIHLLAIKHHKQLSFDINTYLDGR